MNLENIRLKNEENFRNLGGVMACSYKMSNPKGEE